MIPETTGLSGSVLYGFDSHGPPTVFLREADPDVTAPDGVQHSYGLAPHGREMYFRTLYS